MDRSNGLEERNRHFDDLASRSGLMWLGQNTNHFEPCPAVRQAMIDCIEAGEGHRYAPPLGVEELRGAILEDLGLDRDFSVMVTDGAIEGLYHACHTLLGPDDEFVVTDPGWLWPRRFAASRKARVVELSIYDRDAGFRLKPSQLREAMNGEYASHLSRGSEQPPGFHPDRGRDRGDRFHCPRCRCTSPSRLYLSRLRRRAHPCRPPLSARDDHHLQFLQVARTGRTQARSGGRLSGDHRSACCRPAE